MNYFSESQLKVLEEAMTILEEAAQYGSNALLLNNPATASSYFMMRLAHREQEVFAVAFLDAKNRLIECRDMFFGTVDSSRIYIREVIRTALLLNARSIIAAHNHPSGDPEPSEQDMKITEDLKKACLLLDIRLLDHIVVGCNRVVSLTKEGLLYGAVA
ncbi:DNA repair protein RadC [Desulfacinum hydrothermale DSM 13146]|uniref:DNA repair protein RadC n=2 Tax=Desulfacinum hydrothermale TaxID=109258 RepID=A0A1W1XW50_9BACT|nr:DNA repair protein RadC [Desulfacinum hydrothermale DSM 13146]